MNEIIEKILSEESARPDPERAIESAEGELDPWN